MKINANAAALRTLMKTKDGLYFNGIGRIVGSYTHRDESISFYTSTGIEVRIPRDEPTVAVWHDPKRTEHRSWF